MNSDEIHLESVSIRVIKAWETKEWFATQWRNEPKGQQVTQSFPNLKWKGLAVNEYHKKSEVFGGGGRTIIWEVEKPSSLSLYNIMQISDGNMTLLMPGWFILTQHY